MEVTDEMQQFFENELWDIGYNHPRWKHQRDRVIKRIIELHEANKPRPEPVGYIYPSSYEKALRNESSCKMFVVPVTNLDTGEESSIPLYTTPPTREPLSDEGQAEYDNTASAYEEQIKELKATVCALRDPLSNFIALTNESEGVAGYHSNGDIAQWDSFSFIPKAVEMVNDTSGNFYAKRDAEMFEYGYIAGWTTRDCEEGESTAEESFSEFMYEAQRS